MTLNDIGRMLKLAKVPRSKVIQTTYPNPSFVVLVPKDRYFIVANVVGQLKMRTDNVSVKPITDERIGECEHVYVKVTGDNRISPRPADLTRRQHRVSQVMANRNVVVECVSVIS